VPGDTLLGGWVHSSGYAVSLVVLGFAGYLGFPVLAGAAAGDMFSAEDRHGTWKTILTRSRPRSEVFLGKLLAAAALSLALLAVAALSSLVAGLVFTGDQGLVGLSGQTLSAGESLWLVVAAWALSALPLLAFVSLALLLSAASRNGIVGSLGPLLVAAAMQLLALGGTGVWLHSLLLAPAFDGWHGLLASPRFYAPLIIAGGVSVAWIVACAGAAWRILGQRDFAGAPVPRRPGWAPVALATIATAVLLLVLATVADVGPTGVTAARLEASVGPAFKRLTLLQQSDLGRVPSGAGKLDLRTGCRRRGGSSDGPGDDWTCTMTLVSPRPGLEPFRLTPVSYDVSVKSNGCYRADAPPAFVGQRTMLNAERRSVVNPLFTIYGCFDTTGAVPRCTGSTRCAGQGGRTLPSPTGGSGARREGRTPQQLEAERAAGSGVVRETEESQRRLEREGAEANPPATAPQEPVR
jgi:ABC-2 type transport system permease protein